MLTVALPDLAVPLAPLTTLRLGGPARRLVDAETADEVVEALREPALVIGGGSNLVIADEGWPGTVVRISTRGRRVERRPDGSVLLTVEAGEEWDDVVAATVADGLGGLDASPASPGARVRCRCRTSARTGWRSPMRWSTSTSSQAGGAPGPGRRPRAGLPHERAQGPFRRGRAAGADRAARRRAAARPSATPSSPGHSVWRRGSGCPPPSRARPCSVCGAERAWCSTRPTTTPGARAPSSPTPCWRRPRRARRPGRWAIGSGVCGLADRARGFRRGIRGRVAGWRCRAVTFWPLPTVGAVARPICWRWRPRSATACRRGSGCRWRRSRCWSGAPCDQLA